MENTITIAKDANAQPEELLVTVTQPSTTTVFQGSTTELLAEIAACDVQVAAIQKRQADLQALLPQISAQFVAQAITAPAALTESAQQAQLDTPA